MLTAFSADGVSEAWARALNRRSKDPEGAITAARTLLETVDGTVVRTRLDKKATNIVGRWRPSGCAAMGKRCCSRFRVKRFRKRPSGAFSR